MVSAIHRLFVIELVLKGAAASCRWSGLSLLRLDCNEELVDGQQGRRRLWSAGNYAPLSPLIPDNYGPVPTPASPPAVNGDTASSALSVGEAVGIAVGSTLLFVAGAA